MWDTLRLDCDSCRHVLMVACCLFQVAFLNVVGVTCMIPFAQKISHFSMLVSTCILSKTKVNTWFYNEFGNFFRKLAWETFATLKSLVSNGHGRLYLNTWTWALITPVAGSIFRPFSQTHISKRESKNGHISRFCSVSQVIQVISSGKFFSAEEVDLSFKSKTKEHPQVSNPSFWKGDRENVVLQMFQFGEKWIHSTNTK